MPGRVIVGTTPCDCPNALANNNRHLWVRCATEGCPSIWYDSEAAEHSERPRRARLLSRFDVIASRIFSGIASLLVTVLILGFVGFAAGVK